MIRLRAPACASLLACLGSVCGCSSTPGPATQLLVSVVADPLVATQLARVEASSYALDEHDELQPHAQRTFALSPVSPTNAHKLTFLFSFGVPRGRSDAFILVLKGYTTGALEPTIERKLPVRFSAGETTPVEVLLADVCYARPCSGLDHTCHPYASRGRPAGACGSLGTDLPSSMETSSDGSMSDSETARDAAHLLDGAASARGGEIDADWAPATDAVLADAGIEAGLPTTAVGCKGENLCLSPDYPCVASTSTGYSCQGQFAEWPMPDRLPGAKFAPGYDVTSVPGVVVDNVTGLIWQRTLPGTYPGCTGTIDTPSDSCSWHEAKAYCEALTLDGKSWRLPSLIELVSIADETVALPAIDREAFPNMPRARKFWTASPSTFTEGAAWYVDFAGGTANVELGLEEPYGVRCVRSVVNRAATPRDHYRIDAVGDTVTDTRTELVWQRTLNPGPVNWIQAANYCAGLGGGYRLPALKELATLVDPTRGNIPLDAILPNVPDGAVFWSASPALLTTSDHWVIWLGGGGLTGYPQAVDIIAMSLNAPEISYRVWCVR